jgi:hypothetical protein
MMGLGAALRRSRPLVHLPPLLAGLLVFQKSAPKTDHTKRVKDLNQTPSLQAKVIILKNIHANAVLKKGRKEEDRQTLCRLPSAVVYRLTLLWSQLSTEDYKRKCKGDENVFQHSIALKRTSARQVDVSTRGR